MVNAYSQGKGCRLDDTPHHLPTRRNYTIMVGEDVHEDLIALDQRRTNRLTVPSQCGDVINSIVIVIFFNITNNLCNLSELLSSSCPLHDLARLNVYRTKVSCERYTIEYPHTAHCVQLNRSTDDSFVSSVPHS